MFSLRYKFSLVIFILLGLTLGGTLLLLQYHLKQELLSLLHKRLQHVATQQTQQQQARMNYLRETAQALQDNHSLQTFMSQPLYDSAPPTERFLRHYPDVQLLLIYDAQARQWVASSAAQVLLSRLDNLQVLQPFIMRSEDLLAAWIHLPQRSLYVVSQAIFVEHVYKGQLLLLDEVNQQSLESLKADNHFDVLLFNRDTIFLHSGWLGLQAIEQYPHFKALETQLAAALRNEQPGVQQFQLGKEMWHYSVTAAQENAPRYVFSRSLKQQLSVIEELKVKLLLMSALMLFIGILIVLPLFRHISRSVHSLYTAAEQIEKENYEYRTQIQTADEFAKLGKAFNRVMQSLAERERLHAAMQTLVSKELAEQMLKQNLHSAGEERKATVLFSGIRDFSHLVSNSNGQELLAFLNNYFTRMDFCVNAHNGFIDKYFGDNLLALFGLNTEDNDDALQAVLAAREMEEALLLFNLEIGEVRGHTWKMGVGINSGRLIAGNVGAEDRRHYSVIGNPIRLAANLEKLSKTYGASVLISQSTFTSLTTQKGVQPLLDACRELDWIQLGRHTERVKIFQVLSRSQYEQVKNTDFLARFQQGREHLQDHNFRLALQTFQSLHEDWSQDMATRLFLNRCRRYAQDNTRYALENPQGAYVLTAMA